MIAWVVEETEAPMEHPQLFDMQWQEMLAKSSRYPPISGWSGMVARWWATVERRRVEREFMPGGPGAVAAATDWEERVTTMGEGKSMD